MSFLLDTNVISESTRPNPATLGITRAFSPKTQCSEALATLNNGRLSEGS